MSLPRNDYELTFYALRRSGHHAVMVWLAHCFGIPVHVLNDIRPYCDPFETSRFPDNWDHGSEWLLSPGIRENFREEQKHCLMISVQDYDLRRMSTAGDVIPSRGQVLGMSHHQISLLVLRDPFNLLASRWAKPVPLLELLEPSEVLDAWEVYALEYLRQTCFLKRVVFVNFNRWFSSAAYRKELAGSIGVQFSDRGIDIVPKAGGGSSFDLTRFDGRGSQMRVLERWLHFSNDPHFRSVFAKRTRLAALYRQIFDRDESLEKFLSTIGI